MALALLLTLILRERQLLQLAAERPFCKIDVIISISKLGDLRSAVSSLWLMAINMNKLPQ